MMPPRILCYTIALDRSSITHYRQQAHMLVSSLLRTGFTGDIKIIHNGQHKIFAHPRRGVEEIGVDLPEDPHGCYKAKFQVRNLLDVTGYDWVLFLDCDTIVTGPLDDWFNEPEVVKYATEPVFPIQANQFNAYLTDKEMQELPRNGINSGTFLVKAEYYHDVMEEWERIDHLPTLRQKSCCDQPAWNRLLLDSKLPSRRFTQPEVTMYYERPELLALIQTPLVHFCGLTASQKTIMMRAVFLARFYSGDNGSMVEMLER